MVTVVLLLLVFTVGAASAAQEPEVTQQTTGIDSFNAGAVGAPTFNDVMPAFSVLSSAEPSEASAPWRVGVWIGILVLLALAIPRALARRKGTSITWPSAWLKAGVIVVYFAAATMWLPSAVIEAGPVATAPRIVQDLLTSGIWFVALATGIYGLWWAQRDNRI